MNVRAGICLLALISSLPFLAPVQAAEEEGSCSGHVAQWLDPASGEKLDGQQLLQRLAKTRVVLLGETHTSVAHHRWQHYMLSALHGYNPNMMVGFEMLPRAAQPALDEWSAGRLGEKALLEQTQWQKVWGYDADLYLPLLHFARLNRLPALALNIDRELVSRVGQEGWDAISEKQSMGMSEPAPASDAYRESLARLFAYKQSLKDGTADENEQDSPDIDKILESEDFANFVDAQLTWDRAMAEALAAAHRRDPSALVVGIVGRGHLEYGYGIPHQLADMGIDDVDVLLPIDADDECEPLPIDLASAVFVVDADGETAAAARPRLGVYIEDGDTGVRVLQVVDDSVAAAAGLREGDVIQSAAGFDTRTTAGLIEIIQRQAPGTWLPLRLLRGDEVIDKIAKFPQSFD